MNAVFHEHEERLSLSRSFYQKLKSVSKALEITHNVHLASGTPTPPSSCKTASISSPLIEATLGHHEPQK